MGGWEESVCLTAGERAKCGAKAGDRDAMWPETCNPEHSCAASATRAPAASHIRANSQDVCLRCCRVLSRAPTPAILFATMQPASEKNKMQEKCFSSESTPRPHHRVSLDQSSSAALPSADTLRPGPASAPLKTSSSKHLHSQHMSAYVSIRRHTSAYVSIRLHMSAYVSIRQHTSAYVGIRRHTTAYVSACRACTLKGRRGHAEVLSLV
jgi:hypothetical protein